MHICKGAWIWGFHRCKWLAQSLAQTLQHLSRGLTGEDADVDRPIVVEDWRKRLHSICEGYKTTDTFNANEIGLFY